MVAVKQQKERLAATLLYYLQVVANGSGAQAPYQYLLGKVSTLVMMGR